MKQFVFLVLLAATTRIASADDGEAERLYEHGQAAFDAGAFDDAITAWERSYELSKEPGLLFDLGQAYRKRGKPEDCARGEAAYKKFAELDPTSEQRAIALGYIAEMGPCVKAIQLPAPRIHVATQPPMTRVVDNGRSKRIVGLTAIGAGTASIVAGVYFGRRASTIGGEVTSACARSCDWSVEGPKDGDGRRDAKLGLAFDSLGAAAILTGAALYYLGDHDNTIRLEPHGNGAMVSWGGAW